MVVCAGGAGICVAVSLFTFRRGPASPMARREANLAQEIERRKEKHAKVGGISPPGERFVGTKEINIEPKSPA